MRIEECPKPPNSWPDEHIDFFEAFIALFRNSDGTVEHKALKAHYDGFLGHHTLGECYARVTNIRQRKTPVFNRWQSLCLDDT